MPDLLSFLGEVALRSSLVLATTFVLLFVMKGASASERHLVMLFGLLVVAWVPVGLLVSPKISWTISLPRQAETSGPTQKMTAYFLEENKNSLPPASPSVAESKPALPEFLTISNGLAALIVGGMLVQMVVLGRASWSWQKIRRRATKACLPDETLERVQVFAGTKEVLPIFASDQITVPLLAGWLRPAILLPAEANQWPSERLVMVLCHELAHFRRGDSLLLPLICFLRVLYWWHPLLWLALVRLRRERETACDDLVLNQNFRATDYANLIVDAARHARESRWQNGTLAMASTSNVGERIGAILNPKLNRRPASRATIFTGLILAIALGWFLVAAQVQAEDQPVVSGSTAATDAPKPQIELEFKVIAIDETTYLSHQKKIDAAVANSDLVSLITTVNNLPGVSLLSAPSVTTQDGLKANADIVRQFPYAAKFDKDKDGKIVPSDFKTQDVGISVEAMPTLQPGNQAVTLNFKFNLTTFKGWKDLTSGGRVPIFGGVNFNLNGISVGKRGYGFWVSRNLTEIPLPGPNDALRSASKNEPPKRVLVYITAIPVPAETQVPSVPSNEMVYVSLKYFQISEKTYSKQPFAIENALNRGDMSYFNQLPDCLRLAEPAVYIKMGVQGVLEAVKKMSYPVKLVRDSTGKFIPSGTITDRFVGMRFVINPELLADGTISLSCFDEITNFEGWIESNSQEKQPVFNTSLVNGKYALVTGKPFGTWVRTNFDDQSKSMSWKAGDPPSPLSQNTPKVRIAMIITANLYSADGSPILDR
jgi:beta-lactamase regulating signal transducer with metallopeptidase domain